MSTWRRNASTTACSSTSRRMPPKSASRGRRLPSATEQRQDPDAHQYLAAFYHPLPVKLLPDGPRFVPWTDDKTGGRKQPAYIGLQVGRGITRITTRPCPDGAFARQLSLNDILDAAIEALPGDAYAMVMLAHHDLYGDDDDDDFCCGRAYGGSRVAVVSSARYHPALDDAAGIDRAHMWPASHCADHVAALKPRNHPRPLALSRVARTASHELGHCFGLAHCSYYACVMQGTAGLAEDARQPPYLCRRATPVMAEDGSCVVLAGELIDNPLMRTRA
ncbi:hypothetical protein BT67DRAFT_437390 [Trichocladium antarcticum]|uniref:Uncharacterized protein n=1 Tax=Trichocladium antarcticum TaxID=1450529 RepID=A0AAN6UC28_9PEZI|nr:hypothetical protein BT67DRAFT_437390 [Trichocladium antarcticum]